MAGHTLSTDERGARRRLMHALKVEWALLESWDPLSNDHQTGIRAGEHHHSEPQAGCSECIAFLVVRYHRSLDDLMDPEQLSKLRTEISQKIDQVYFLDPGDKDAIRLIRSEVRDPHPWGASQVARDPRHPIQEDAREDDMTGVSENAFQEFYAWQLEIFRTRIAKGNVVGDGRINIDNEMNREDGLPLPWVCYPPLYGAFPSFSGSDKGPWFMCDCQRSAVRRIHDAGGKVSRLIAECVGGNLSDDPVKNITWREAICHRCTKQVPGIGTFLYPPDSIAPDFSWKDGYILETPPRWGMYTQISFYELGIKPKGPYGLLRPEHHPASVNHGWDFDFNNPDTSVRSMVERVINADKERLRYVDEFNRRTNFVVASQVVTDAVDETRIARLQLWRHIENDVRSLFGISPVGSTGKQEQVLYELVKEVFEGHQIQRNVREKWLEYLELDIWIPELKLGIEYQGEQHFRPIEHWGGSERLNEQQKRDARKKELCRKRGITLVEFFYYEKLNLKLVKEKLVPGF